MSAADAELDTAERLVHGLRQPAQWWLVMNARAMLALFHGMLVEAERLIDEVRERGERAQQMGRDLQLPAAGPTSSGGSKARLEEVETIIQRSICRLPDALRPRVTILAHLYAELGRLTDARRAYGELAFDGFASVRRDNDWLFEMSLLRRGGAVPRRRRQCRDPLRVALALRGATRHHVAEGEHRIHVARPRRSSRRCSDDGTRLSAISRTRSSGTPRGTRGHGWHTRSTTTP